MTQFYLNIRAIRERIGMTKKQMAEKLCIEPSTYGKQERGETHITVEQLFKISEILCVTPDYIINYQKYIEGSALDDQLRKENENMSRAIKEAVHITNDLQTRLNNHSRGITNLLFSELSKYSAKYEEPLSYEELLKYDPEILTEVYDIHSKQEYDECPLVYGVSPEGNLLAFAEMMGDSNMFFLFEINLVEEEYFLKLWKEYCERWEPKFEMKEKDGCTVISTTNPIFSEMLNELDSSKKKNA
ncbi:MAG: helix-turn-helix transcriptional regulator [Bacteroidetes bacterium]|nr:helix-turn-helix transcriptional regulator [Bacteroidota bacterium]